MLFASDLDGTLIYSRRLIESIDGETDYSLRLIETLNGKEISFTSEAIIKKLKMINQHIFFVPTTTRSLQQYNRIRLFREEVKPTYAIVNNGGTILKNGEPMVEWQGIIQEKIKEMPLTREAVYKKFSEIKSSEWVTSAKEVDDLFTYFLIDRDKVKREKLTPLFVWLKENQWTGSLQGRKLYLIPNCVNKREPILFLMKKLGLKEFIAAGDSFLDLPMLRATSRAIVPCHGELIEGLGKGLAKEGIKYTTNKGVAAGEEILDFVVKACIDLSQQNF